MNHSRGQWGQSARRLLRGTLHRVGKHWRALRGQLCLGIWRRLCGRAKPGGSHARPFSGLRSDGRWRQALLLGGLVRGSRCRGVSVGKPVAHRPRLATVPCGISSTSAICASTSASSPRGTNRNTLLCVELGRDGVDTATSSRESTSRESGSRSCASTNTRIIPATSTGTGPSLRHGLMGSVPHGFTAQTTLASKPRSAPASRFTGSG